MKIFRFFLLIITLLFGTFFLSWVYTHFKEQDFSALKQPKVAFSIIVAALLYACVIPLSSWAWQKLLLSFHESLSVKKLACIMGSTQIAKYTPGNILQHIGRFALSSKSNIKTKAYIYSVTLELGLSILASIFIACLSALLFFPNSSLGPLSAITLVVTLSLILAFGTIFYFVPINWLNRYTSPQNCDFRQLKGATISAFTIYSFNYLLVGTGMWLILASMALTNEISYSQITIAFCISWLAGLLAPGAPAGLGAREATLIIILSNQTPETSLLALILAMRVATVIGDGLCFAASTYILVREKRDA